MGALRCPWASGCLKNWPHRAANQSGARSWHWSEAHAWGQSFFFLGQPTGGWLPLLPYSSSSSSSNMFCLVADPFSRSRMFDSTPGHVRRKQLTGPACWASLSRGSPRLPRSAESECAEDGPAAVRRPGAAFLRALAALGRQMLGPPRCPFTRFGAGFP